jgi:hypothetical protein
MRQGAMSLRRAMQPGPGEVPAQVRFLGKFVLEVLPAALASVIGAFLFAHYQFGEPGMSPAASSPATEAAPASATMMQLLRQEHAMIRDFLLAEQAAEEKRIAADDAADANAVADAQIAAAARQALLAEIVEKPVAETAEKPVAEKPVAEKPVAKRSKGTVMANAATGRGSVPTAQLPTVVVAAAQPDPALMPAPPPPPRASFVSRTLALPGHAMALTLHAVASIGGIPSWIGHHVGAGELDSDAPPPGAAF